MTATRIMNGTKKENSVSSLPTHPTAPKAFGGLGYTSAQMKAAFDRLPHLLCDKFNALLDDIAATDDTSLAAAMPTGISSGHTLRQLFCDISDGSVLSYIKFEDTTLAAYIVALRNDVDKLLGAIDE